MVESDEFPDHTSLPSKETLYNRDMRAIMDGVSDEVQRRAESKPRDQRPVGLCAKLLAPKRAESADGQGGPGGVKNSSCYSSAVPALGDIGSDGEPPVADAFAGGTAGGGAAKTAKGCRTLHWISHEEHKLRLLWLLFWYYLPDEAAKAGSQPPPWMVDIVEHARSVLVHGRERMWPLELIFWAYFKDR